MAKRKSAKLAFELEVQLDDMLDLLASEEQPPTKAPRQAPWGGAQREAEVVSSPNGSTAAAAAASSVVQQEKEEQEEEEPEDQCDVHLALEGLWNMTGAGGARSMRCALQHQLYAVFDNRTYVDSCVQALREAGTLRAFNCPVGTLLMAAADYAADAARDVSPPLPAFARWARRCPATSVTLGRLLKGQLHPSATSARAAALSCADVDRLVAAGYLLARRDAAAGTSVQAYWFHHPRLGPSGADIADMRKVRVNMCVCTACLLGFVCPYPHLLCAVSPECTTNRPMPFLCTAAPTGAAAGGQALALQGAVPAAGAGHQAQAPAAQAARAAGRCAFRRRVLPAGPTGTGPAAAVPYAGRRAALSAQLIMCALLVGG